MRTPAVILALVLLAVPVARGQRAGSIRAGSTRLALADAQGALEAEQRSAWAEEVYILKKAVAGLDGMLFLEFDVPRLDSRIDAALISGPAVFPFEFKCGERRFTTDAFNQVWDSKHLPHLAIAERRPVLEPRYRPRPRFLQAIDSHALVDERNSSRSRIRH